jgi:hypothetical protein
MKLFTRLSTLALAALLAACGGSNTFVISGNVAGLTQSGLILSNRGEMLSIPAGSTMFRFPNAISYGTEFNIQIVANPQFLQCNILITRGSAGTTSTNNSDIICTRAAFSLGGTVTGLNSAGLVLSNGLDTVAIPATSTAFLFPVTVAGGTPLNVRVQNQPMGKTCTVTGGTGIMPEMAFNGLVVTCV